MVAPSSSGWLTIIRHRDTTAAPGLLDDWNCAHPVKIPFGWEGQLHECQQQYCVDLSLLVDHLTFVVGCFEKTSVNLHVCVYMHQFSTHKYFMVPSCRQLMCALSNQKGEVNYQTDNFHPSLICINKRLWVSGPLCHCLC